MRQLVTSPPVMKQEADRKWGQAKKLQDPNSSEHFLYLGPTSRSPIGTKCSNIQFFEGMSHDQATTARFPGTGTENYGKGRHANV